MSNGNTSGLTKGYTAPKTTTSVNNVFRFRQNILRSLESLELNRVIRRLAKGDDVKTGFVEVEVTNDEAVEIKNLTERFLDEFDDYLLNGDYNQTEAERLLVQMKLDGQTNSLVMQRLNLTASSSLRTKYARLSKKVYEHLFNQSRPISGVEQLNKSSLRKAEVCIRTAMFHFDLASDFNYEFAGQIKDIITDKQITKGTYLDSDIDAVVHFLALYSSGVFKANLAKLNKSALQAVIESLSKQTLLSTENYAYRYKVLTSMPLNLLVDSKEGVLSDIKDCSETFDLAREFIKDSKNFAAQSFEDVVATSDSSLHISEKTVSSGKSGVANKYNLPVDDDFVAEIDKVLSAYKRYSQHHMEHDIPDKYALDSNEEASKKVKLFLSKLPFDGAKEELWKLNPFTLGVVLNVFN